MTQILAFCTQAKPKARIIYNINLSYEQLKTYLALLTSQNLLAHNPNGYVTTEKGHRFLDAFAKLNYMLK